MKIKNYIITLRQPVIISESVASVGTHQCLDYIKGSTLLGLLASRLYRDLATDDAFLLFHSGKVRFTDALPVTNYTDQTAYPVPMCLHSFKAEKYADDDVLNADKLFDIAKVGGHELLRESMKQRQPVQLRNFYITVDGKRVSPIKERTLKTAIDPQKNIAKEAQLFGYEALSSGQRFSFSIEADDDIPDKLWGKLTAQTLGKARLGRSRSAQFGAVHIEKDNSIKERHKFNDSYHNELTMWLLSDMQLYNGGQPTLVPKSEFLGLPEGTQWLVESSFLRSRRYSMYNAYRRHYDKEQQVINRGSVLRYKLPQDFTNHDTLYEKLYKGIGSHTEYGLGQVWINPKVLSGIHPSWKSVSNNKVKTTTLTKKPKLAPEDSVLISTLLKKQQIAEVGTLPRQIATEVFNKLCIKITKARRYQGLVKGMPLNPAPPSKNQFGRFKELANQYRNKPEALWKSLITSDVAMLKVTSEGFNDNRQSGASYKRAGWELKYALQTNASLGEFLQEELTTYKSQSYFAYIIAELANLGLSDTWEEFCIGIRPTVAEQQLANQSKEQA